MLMKSLMLGAALLALPLSALAEHEPSCEEVVWHAAHRHYHCVDIVPVRAYDPSPLVWLGVGAIVGHGLTHGGHHRGYAAHGSHAYHGGGHSGGHSGGHGGRHSGGRSGGRSGHH